MKKHTLEFLVGLFVLAGMGAVAYLTIKLGSGAMLGGNTHLIEARFANSGGLNRGANVLLAGVVVGRVEKISLDLSDFSAIATLRVRSDIPLPADTMASIKTTGLIGDKYVALSPGAEEDILHAGDRITMTESAVDLESLIGKMAFGNVQDPPAESAPSSSTTATNESEENSPSPLTPP